MVEAAVEEVLPQARKLEDALVRQRLAEDPRQRRRDQLVGAEARDAISSEAEQDRQPNDPGCAVWTARHAIAGRG